MLMIVNKFMKYCAVCGCKVETGAGFSRKEESGTWLTYCNSHKPVGDLVQPKVSVAPVVKTITTPAPHVNPISQTRELTEDGQIVIKPWTYDSVTLVLIKTMPGRHYDGDTKTWSVSTVAKDRAEVLKIARKLNLQIHSSWLDGVDTRADAAKKRGLYSYQVSGVDWLNRQDKAILGDDMGLGKTCQSLMALEADCGPVIILCPKNVKYNWVSEIKIWRPDLEPMVISGLGGFDQGLVALANCKQRLIAFNSQIRRNSSTQSNNIVSSTETPAKLGQIGFELSSGRSSIVQSTECNKPIHKDGGSVINVDRPSSFGGLTDGTLTVDDSGQVSQISNVSGEAHGAGFPISDRSGKSSNLHHFPKSIASDPNFSSGVSVRHAGIDKISGSTDCVLGNTNTPKPTDGFVDSHDKNLNILSQPKQLVLIANYDVLPNWLVAKKGQTVQWQYERLAIIRETTLICDEAHNVKNSKTGKHKKIKTLVQKVKKAWFLTGTPLTNKVNDLLGLLFALGRFNDTFGTLENFVERFQVTRNHFGYEWGDAKPDKFVPDILSKVMLRRTREQVLPDLPDITYQTLVINELSDKLRMQLDIVQEENEGLLALNVLPPFELFSACRYQLANARIPAMIEFVEDCEEQDVPLVVFSAHRGPIDTLKDRPGWAVITGDTPVAQRQEIAEKFQRGELLGLGQTIQTAIGSNLSYAYTALFIDLDWTPALNSQAEHRLLRIGQKSSKINVVRMVSNHPLDIHCHNLLSNKIVLIKETVG